MVTFRQLRYFSALAETRHFGAAAEKSSVTQPALSVQIRELEKSLGLPLVERRSSGAVLTVEGEEVARRSRAILGLVRDLGDYALQRGGLATGPLRIGAIPSIAPYLMPRVLRFLAETYPDLELSLRENITDTLVAGLVAGDLDVIFVALPVDHPEIETMALFEDAFLLAEPGDRPGRPRPPTFEDIADERLLLLEEGHCLRNQALSLCGRSNADGTTGFGASSLATVLQMVAAGYGVTLLPELAAGDVTMRGLSVELSRFAAPEPGRVIGLGWRAHSPRRDDFRSLARLFGKLETPGLLGKPEPAGRRRPVVTAVQ